MLWGKKKPDTPKPSEPARPPLPKAVVQPVPSSRPSWTPSPDARETVTLRDLPEMLLTHANVTREQLQHALEIQHETGDFIGEILVNEGVLDENSLVAFLAKYCKIPHLSLLDYLIDEKLLDVVSPAFCLRHKLIPIDKMGRNLTVAMVNPLNLIALESLQEDCPDLRIKPILCTTKHFDAVAKRLFGRQSGQEQSAPEAETLPEDHAPAPDPSPAVESVTAEASDLDGVIMPARDAAAPDAVAPDVTEEDLPFAAEYDPPIDERVCPSEEEEHQDALLNSVFSLGTDSVRGDLGHDADDKDSAGLDDVTRKMTTAMVQSMRNTYEVLARRISLFRRISPESVAKLFARGKTVEYEAGQTIFRKGEQGRYMYVILNGSVDIIDDGRALAHLKQGEIFGEMALMSNAARSASAKTVTATSLLMLSFGDITQDLDNVTSVQLLVNMTITLSSRLRRAQSL